MLGLGLSFTGVATRARGPLTDALAEKLAAMELAGTLVSAWFLPLDDPAQYLTLNGAAVEGWDAAYGSQKVSLTELTAPPQWDATLFGNRGGVTFNGSSQYLTGAGNVANWPDASTDLWLLLAWRNDATAGARCTFAYGSSSTDTRALTHFAAQTETLRVSSALATSSPGSYGGPRTTGGRVDIGGTSILYRNGASAGFASTASAALTRSRVRMGADCGASPSQFAQCAIVAAAIGTGAFPADLEALMRARVT